MTIGDLWDGLLEGLGTLLSFFYDLIPSYGVAIILLTVAVRTLMIPLTIKQTRSMQGISKIQPEMMRLKAKYKGDRQKQTEEIQKLYREHGVNPLGGCLPVILQMPVFFALFQVFQRCGKRLNKGETCPTTLIGVQFLPKDSALRAAIGAGQAGFLGMDLGRTPLQAYRVEGLVPSLPYFVWVLLMTATMYYQQKQISSVQAQAGQAAAQSQMLMRIMPVMFGFFSLNFPVALTIYWVTSNLWTIGQQYLMLGRKTKASTAASPETPRPAAPQPVAPADNDRDNPGSREPGSQSRPGKPKGSGARRRRKRKRR